MKRLKLLWVLLALFSLGAAPDGGVLIRGARVFDGTGAPAHVADVLIRGERIAAVGPRLRPPRGARVVDARGLSLIPGLHDLHAHLRAPGLGGPEDLGKAYAGHLDHGVTTVDDFSVSGEMLAPIREMTGSGQVAAFQPQRGSRAPPSISLSTRRSSSTSTGGVATPFTPRAARREPGTPTRARPGASLR